MDHYDLGNGIRRRLSEAQIALMGTTKVGMVAFRDFVLQKLLVGWLDA